MSLHLGFSIAIGAYFIYTLFHKVGEHGVNDCIIDNIKDPDAAKECKEGFKFARGIIVCIFILFWLFELCAFLFLSLPP